MRVKAIHRHSDLWFINKPFFKYLKRENKRSFIFLNIVNDEYD